MAQGLNFYTRLYPDFLDDEMCDAYVASFEETMEKDVEEVKEDLKSIEEKLDKVIEDK